LILRSACYPARLAALLANDLSRSIKADPDTREPVDILGFDSVKFLKMPLICPSGYQIQSSGHCGRLYVQPADMDDHPVRFWGIFNRIEKQVNDHLGHLVLNWPAQ
jgi:hypothetical protein